MYVVALLLHISSQCFEIMRHWSRISMCIWVGSLNSRCSINTDVLTDISTDQEVRDDIATDDCGYIVPVLHLKSNILEIDALNLLAKGTVVDTLLTILPI